MFGTSTSFPSSTFLDYKSFCYRVNTQGEHYLNPPTFGTFFMQVDAPFETIRYCGFEW